VEVVCGGARAVIAKWRLLGGGRVERGRWTVSEDGGLVAVETGKGTTQGVVVTLWWCTGGGDGDGGRETGWWLL
jgi:hypothetical protein